MRLHHIQVLPNVSLLASLMCLYHGESWYWILDLDQRPTPSSQLSVLNGACHCHHGEAPVLIIEYRGKVLRTECRVHFGNLLASLAAAVP